MWMCLAEEEKWSVVLEVKEKEERRVERVVVGWREMIFESGSEYSVEEEHGTTPFRTLVGQQTFPVHSPRRFRHNCQIMKFQFSILKTIFLVELEFNALNTVYSG